jgi:hypothetical protein
MDGAMLAMGMYGNFIWPNSTYESRYQGCQMVYFQTKNPNSGLFLYIGLGMENLDIFMAILVLLSQFGVL